MERGERIRNRTKNALTRALAELVRETNYADITIQDIVDRAEVGRSTFYRHFGSKADVMVEIHRGIFDDLFQDHLGKDAWLSPTPPAQLTRLLRRFRGTHSAQISISFKLGSDLDILVRDITSLLAATIHDRLQVAFDGAPRSIPLDILANTIAATHISIMMRWLARDGGGGDDEMAGYIQRLTGASIREAISRPEN